ncbi:MULTISPECIES: ABC transporter substrate-binding protein [unclassified Nodularia (in: cyanobacteria)]|uniref:caspase, EACC1-associated type n=1 Tax=unclassified Nodularia (in: cyanobacteria) TaxID=2656917 RepID=UPI00187EFD3A|nr:MULTISPECIES: ABC transporter substrate-binding protein [unclassified Nodularia (in: cyanobacteria)]MBE9201779.1 ABC transporter substrate-binding protein [Nodularia sp. LEGE 06071]MCC2694449.1 ABC transporter substrate-binding protein [Nodularia sp. LEGE 04288]
MAKFALLIGVSEYEGGLPPLPAAVKDVEAMERVLQHPEIGNFDVEKLVNPQRQEMAEAIEILFKGINGNGRQKDDLILLFFSGHGIKDERGHLYFATRNTRKTDNGLLLQATTVPASFVHDVMSNSRSKREVVILDCCFSGAFAEGMSAKDNGFVDVKNQLGGEGRAILTSSTSTEYSFEDTGTDTSIYTRYVVEGLGTGVADKDKDGWISVDELHEYATRKVQEASPAMKPQIYAIKEGYKINLAKAPNDHPHLQYRVEVEYWVEGGNGEISSTGRSALEELRNKLQLTTEEAKGIENQVLEPFKIYQQKLSRYEQALGKEIELKFPLSDKAITDLKRFQQVLGLTDEAIALIEAPIIAKQQTNKTPVSSDIASSLNSNILNKNTGLGIIIGTIIGGTVFAMFLRPSVPKSCAVDTYTFSDKMSVGEEILLTQNTNPDKQAGVKALAKGDCQTAINKLNLYRQANRTNRSDPEALIYLNNAKALQQTQRLKIAVSVPIGSNPDVAQELLRGVAQAQNEVNNNNGIQGKLLLVEIANDNNDPVQSERIASQFVKDNNILAVVGHNTSDASLRAAPKYELGGLVMIAPTGFSDGFSNAGTYIFRAIPRIRLSAVKLANYIITTVDTSNIAICRDFRNLDNDSVRDHFVTAVVEARATINNTHCDLSDDNLNAEVKISEAINSGANALFLAPHIDRISNAIKLAKAANQRGLPIFSSPTMYTNETLEKGKADVNGMVLTAAWHPQAFPNNPFANNALNLWGGIVNWRTATAYDATKAIIKGLQQSNTRSELQQVLRNSNFSADGGAVGNIKFEPSGDRKGDFVLIKIQKKSGIDKYEFVRINP